MSNEGPIPGFPRREKGIITGIAQLLQGGPGGLEPRHGFCVPLAGGAPLAVLLLLGPCEAAVTLGEPEG